jgi:hypothetical protein
MRIRRRRQGLRHRAGRSLQRSGFDLDYCAVMAGHPDHACAYRQICTLPSNPYRPANHTLLASIDPGYKPAREDPYRAAFDCYCTRRGTLRGFGLSILHPRREWRAIAFAACCTSFGSSGTVRRHSTIAACSVLDAGTPRL